MEYRDRVYGTMEITEPVLLELIDSPSLQRLKAVDQIGYFEPHFPGTAHSRFEHSLGVCLLLQRFGAPLAEQIAGLIHDVSHAAFSHCIDYALGLGTEREQSHQDNVFAEFVGKSEIPKLLSRYGYQSTEILDDKNFPLKEKPLPDLCADRLDYSLRTAVIFADASVREVNQLLGSLTTEDGNWVFDDFAPAQRYAELFLRLNTNYYAGRASAVMFTTIGAYLRYALRQGYVTESDLYTTDAAVLAKIRPHHQADAQLKLRFDRMNGTIKFTENPRDFDAHVGCKSRAVDPRCRHGGKLLRISDVDPHWATVVKEESQPKEYGLKFAR